ncbi:MAG: hypothetical protein AAB019_02770 [Planctomycetota bacterium]
MKILNGWTHSFTQIWGKIRRAYLADFRPAYVKQSLANRVGECRRCGACCRLLFDCWWLNQNCHPATCRHYTLRSQVCRVFPINNRDLKDRDLVNPQQKCGFSFRD